MNRGTYSIANCAHCGGAGTHHVRVDVLVRRREDDNTAALTRVEVPDPFGTRRLMPLPAVENPSLRRSGLTVTLLCELCDGVSLLEIAQHKGETQIMVVKA
jgi:hypothetical protein